jgi:anaerobic ribonucleoside-triphosphate reductase
MSLYLQSLQLFHHWIGRFVWRIGEEYVEIRQIFS